MEVRVLCVVSHPDDEALGAGGTLAKHAQAGDEVSILILGTGIDARGEDKEARARLRDASAAASHIMTGKASTQWHAFQDNCFDAHALLSLVKVVEAEMRRFSPEIVYTHHGQDLNVDHRLTHQAVLTACRPLPDSSVRRILAFEVLSATEWGLAPFCPTVFVSIEGEPLKTKLYALKAYESEMREFPHPRSIPNVMNLACLRGATAGVIAAEAFELIREIQ